jgi:hypothetical protein
MIKNLTVQVVKKHKEANEKGKFCKKRFENFVKELINKSTSLKAKS